MEMRSDNLWDNIRVVTKLEYSRAMNPAKVCTSETGLTVLKTS
jgi:hypothetical protein